MGQAHGTKAGTRAHAAAYLLVPIGLSSLKGGGGGHKAMMWGEVLLLPCDLPILYISKCHGLVQGSW